VTRPRPTDNSNPLGGVLRDAFRLVEFVLVGPPSPREPNPLAAILWTLLRFLLFIVLFVGMGAAPRWVRELVLGGAQFRSNAGTQRLVRPLDGFTGPARPVR